MACAALCPGNTTPASPCSPPPSAATPSYPCPAHAGRPGSSRRFRRQTRPACPRGRPPHGSLAGGGACRTSAGRRHVPGAQGCRARLAPRGMKHSRAPHAATASRAGTHLWRAPGHGVGVEDVQVVQVARGGLFILLGHCIARSQGGDRHCAAEGGHVRG